MYIIITLPNKLNQSFLITSYNEHCHSTNPQSRRVCRHFPAHQGIYRTGEYPIRKESNVYADHGWSPCVHH